MTMIKTLLPTLCLGLMACGPTPAGDTAATPAPEKAAGTPAAATAVAVEDRLAGIRLGATVKELEATYPGLYRRSMPLGEKIYQACDEKTGVQFTFTEQPWARERIISIAVEREEDPQVCRGDGNIIPAMEISAETSKGVRPGTPVAQVAEKYGTPTSDEAFESGYRVLRYQAHAPASDAGLHNVRLVLLIRENAVVSITLVGEPSKTKP